MGFEKLTGQLQKAFKEKSDKALAMFGNSDTINQIIESEAFNEYNIELISKDYATVDELMQGIKDVKRAKYVLISDTGLVGIENGKYEVIKQIRSKYPNVVIAVFFNDEKKDEMYKNWAFGYKVYHIYYANDNDSHDFAQIAAELAENSIPTSNTNEQNKELEEKEELIRQKEKELGEKVKQLQELEERLADTENMEPTEENSGQVDFLKEQIKKMQQYKKEEEGNVKAIKEEHELEKKELERKLQLEILERQKDSEEADRKLKAQIEEIKTLTASATASQIQIKTLGCITIGVFSISPGAGSTYTSIRLAEQLGAAGFPTAVIAYDGSRELKYAGGDYAHYFVPEGGNKKTMLLETINSGYNVIIVDFGYLFPISPLGEIEIRGGSISDRKEDIDELLRCTYKIAVGFSDPWHIGKLNFFIDNEILDQATSIYSIVDYTGNRDLQKCSLNLCERDINKLTQVMFEWLGIARKNEEKLTKKRGLFGNKERKIDNR